MDNLKGVLEVAVFGDGKPLTGSRAALMELFSRPMFVPHAMRLGLRGKERKAARQDRLHRYQWALRMQMADRAKDRFGMDTAASDDINAQLALVVYRGVLRNARKRERKAARG